MTKSTVVEGNVEGAGEEFGEDLYAQYETDRERELAGAWFERGKNSKQERVAFKLTRMVGHNARYKKRLEAATKPYRRQIELKTLPDRIADDVYRSVFCETILTDWVGVRGRDGELIPFSPDAAKKLLSDLPDLAKELEAFAADASNYLAGKRDGDAKN